MTKYTFIMFSHLRYWYDYDHVYLHYVFSSQILVRLWPCIPSLCFLISDIGTIMTMYTFIMFSHLRYWYDYDHVYLHTFIMFSHLRYWYDYDHVYLHYVFSSQILVRLWCDVSRASVCLYCIGTLQEGKWLPSGKSNPYLCYKFAAELLVMMPCCCKTEYFA